MRQRLKPLLRAACFAGLEALRFHDSRTRA